MTIDQVSLLDILACPRCHGAVAGAGQEALQCRACGHRYPLQAGVPVMLLDPARAQVQHQADLGVRPEYSRWKERIVIKSLLDGQVVLDFGAGRQAVDDPCIVRMDLMLNPYVDVSGAGRGPAWGGLFPPESVLGPARMAWTVRQAPRPTHRGR